MDTGGSISVGTGTKLDIKVYKSWSWVTKLISCCSNHQSQRLIASQAVNHLVEYYYGDHKRTW